MISFPYEFSDFDKSFFFILFLLLQQLIELSFIPATTYISYLFIIQSSKSLKQWRRCHYRVWISATRDLIAVCKLPQNRSYYENILIAIIICFSAMVNSIPGQFNVEDIFTYPTMVVRCETRSVELPICIDMGQQQKLPRNCTTTCPFWYNEEAIVFLLSPHPISDYVNETAQNIRILVWPVSDTFILCNDTFELLNFILNFSTFWTAF